MLSLPLSVRRYFTKCCWKKLSSRNFLFSAALVSCILVMMALMVTNNSTPRRIVRLVPRIPFCNCTIFTDPPTEKQIVVNITAPEETGSASDPSSLPVCSDIPRGFLKRKHLTRHTPLINANCYSLFQGNATEISSIRHQNLNWVNKLGDNEFFAMILKKSTAVKLLANNFYISQKERDFPIAFVLLLHYKPGNIQQYFRLLKFLYRPQNVYCLHLDTKSPVWWSSKIKQLASMFPNIIMAGKPVEVQYSTVSILQAHLNCFEDLLKSGLQWKYVINLHSTELPLVTNKEIVEALEQAEGRNIILTGTKVSDFPEESLDYQRVHFKCKWNGKTCQITKSAKPAPNFEFELYKSADSANCALTHSFVSFVLSDQRAKSLKNFLLDVRSAVELFFNTLNQLPDAPGSLSLSDENITLPQVAKRYWKDNHQEGFCTSKRHVHHVCIANVGDLPALKQASEERRWFFYNKYLLHTDHVVMDCIEDLLLRRNRDEYFHDCH